MADNQTLDTLSLLNKGAKAFDWASKIGGGSTLGTGGYLPGAVAAYQGPGAGAAVASGATLASAMPFLGLAGFNLANMAAAKLIDRPQFTLSGLNPEIGVSQSGYSSNESGYDAQKPSSQKYDYYLDVRETDNDSQTRDQLIQHFDNYFDQLSAQGVPVNDMLKRNEMFKFGGDLGRLDEIANEISTHFKPDVDAYISGNTPPERTIQARISGPRSDGMSGRDAYDMGIADRGSNTITIPGGTTQTSLPSQPTQGGDTMASGAFVPSSIPANLQPGYSNFVDGSSQANDQYQGMADELWNDYLEFENRYLSNLSGMPQVNLQMPGTMGGATIPLAPKVHSAMYTDQLNAQNRGVAQRDALSQNMFKANLQNLQNAFMPTQAGMDLYQMERAGQLGLDRVNAGKYEPSSLSTLAPVVGSFLQSDQAGSAMDGLWDVGKGLWDAGSGLVTSAWDALF